MQTWLCRGYAVIYTSILRKAKPYKARVLAIDHHLISTIKNIMQLICLDSPSLVTSPLGSSQSPEITLLILILKTIQTDLLSIWIP